eukprot:CAMPEP_0202689782 /NCGR_PEP_ID=MMETSP1385-20130828/4968_1 /ASSEMBLY_ACC=CAM_ASM_000861 /TAXON_ID=933848 /ORGANISM="Elphidium margaritaceum" /LENGTH=617 /DNA_ID=CAMNT_0049344969 /DNA_START=42 /DNA_END=1895 /DNA_ORIENTATION=+
MSSRKTNNAPSKQMMLAGDRLVIVMVGLPARGKSYMGKKLYRYLRHLQLVCKVFNCGSYRRIATKNTTVGKASADFFDPDNTEAVRIRTQCALDAMADIISWFNTGGQVGILDATNTTIERRKLIRQFFKRRESELEYDLKLVYVESICNDESIIHQNIITVKLKNPDYCTVDAQQAIADFHERIRNYEKKYVPVSKEEGSYIKVINVGSEINGYMLNDYLSCRILYFLMHLHLHSESKTPRKPLLMQLKNRNDALQDKLMEDKLRMLSESVGTKFKQPAYDRPVHALAPFMRRPSYFIWTDIEDTYKEEANAAAASASSGGLSAKSPSVKHKLALLPLSAQNSTSSTANKSPTSPNEMQSPTSLRNNINYGGASPGGAGARRDPPFHARRSTTLLKLIKERNSESDLLSGDDANSKHTLTLIKTPSIKFADDMHEETKTQSPAAAAHTHEAAEVAPAASDENDQDTDLALDEEEIEEDDDFDESALDKDFSCQLCGRTVNRADTTLVDNGDADNEKIRICEVCLYESDSDNDTGADASQFIHIEAAMNGPPAPMVAQRSDEDLDMARRKTQQIRNYLSSLIDEMSSDKNAKAEDLRPELMKLQQDITALCNMQTVE